MVRKTVTTSEGELREEMHSDEVGWKTGILNKEPLLKCRWETVKSRNSGAENQRDRE